jgi:hypothetical protein
MTTPASTMQTPYLPREKSCSLLHSSVKINAVGEHLYFGLSTTVEVVGELHEIVKENASLLHSSVELNAVVEHLHFGLSAIVELINNEKHCFSTAGIPASSSR